MRCPVFATDVESLKVEGQFDRKIEADLVVDVALGATLLLWINGPNSR